MEECSICLENLWGDITLLKCNHKFHTECIKIVKNRACPLCRNELVKIGKLNVYYSDSSVRYKIKEPNCCVLL
jgi:hypothetical protein|tara:strand:+ start:7985 stop:8203 length:219 start_codon:yes stop_codon:yes gene_type:complete